MKPLNDVPQKSKAVLTAAATTIRKEVGRAERVISVFEKKYDHLCFLAVKNLNNSEVFAKDIVADVLLDALNNWPDETFDKIKDLESFICRCVLNRSSNFRKRNSRYISVNDFPLDSLLITNPMTKLDLDLDEVTNLLSPKQRDVLSLYCKGYSHKEIAQMLQCSEGTSKNNICEVKKILRAKWNVLPDDDPDEPKPSGKRSKVQRKSLQQNNRLLSEHTRSVPTIKDLMDYLSGYEQNARTRNAILLWIITDKYAADIIAGLKFTMNNNNRTAIETQLKKDKDNLRRRLMETIQSKDNPGNRFLFNPAQSSFQPFIIEKGKKTSLPTRTEITINPVFPPVITQPGFLLQNREAIGSQQNNPVKYDLNKLIAYYLLSKGIVMTMHDVRTE